MKQILIVEDHKDISELLKENLELDGFKVHIVSSLTQAFSFFSLSPNIDLVILDLILPDGDGLEILKYMRTSGKYKNIPVIILSARGQELDRVLGLELGADDYVVKPFSLRELILRVRKLLKRVESKPSELVSVGPFTLDKNKKAIYYKDILLDLTTTEYKILSLFVENPHKVFTREELLYYIWGNYKEYYSRVLDAYICRLRNKLKAEDYIQTVRGLGYRFVPEESSDD